MAGQRGGLPNLGAIRSEIGELEGKRSSLESTKSNLNNAISQLQDKKSEISHDIAEMHAKLGEEIPPQIRTQILERIAMMKNARNNLNQQLTDLRDRLNMIGESLRNLETGIGGRKSLFQRVAGFISNQSIVRTVNREQKGVGG